MGLLFRDGWGVRSALRSRAVGLALGGILGALWGGPLLRFDSEKALWNWESIGGKMEVPLTIWGVFLWAWCWLLYAVDRRWVDLWL